MRSRWIAMGLVAVVVAACGMPPSPTPADPDLPGPSGPSGATATASHGPLRLSAAVDPATVASGHVINVTTTLSNEGSEPIEITGSGTGIVFFTVTRLEDGLTSGLPFMDGDCRAYPMAPGQRTDVPFSKSGGYSPDDPHAAFMDAYYADPELRLPAGTWHIDVAAYGSIGDDCSGPPLELAVRLVVVVTE